jgi:hypothetical protein
MRNHASNQPDVRRVQAIVQDALRAAVHAPSEREGFDLLADALLRVNDLATAANRSTQQ